MNNFQYDTQGKEIPGGGKVNSLGYVENLYTPNSIRTYTGRYVNVMEPTPDMICLEDIAHALSNQCRFGGHLPSFYSVARHSLNCSYLVDDSNKLSALMHDASEAYLLDIPRPVKKNLSNYKEIENSLMTVIAEKFGFTWPLSESVKRVDEEMLQFEWDGLMLQKFQVDCGDRYTDYSLFVKFASFYSKS